MPAAQALLRSFRRLSLDDSPSQSNDDSAAAAAPATPSELDGLPAPTHSAALGHALPSRARDISSRDMSASHSAVSAGVSPRGRDTLGSAVSGVPTHTTSTRVRDALARTDAAAPHAVMRDGIPIHGGTTTHAHSDIPNHGSTDNATFGALATILIDNARKKERRARAKAARRGRRAAARAKVPESAMGTAEDDSDSGSIPSLETVLDSEDPSSDDVNGASSDEDIFDSE